MKISCVIPVYNAERYLEEALQSALTQDVPPHEVIAVDDGSTDDSLEILRRHAPAVTVVERAHAGIPVTRNAGLRQASGDWIAFLDADDLWPPGRLRAMLGALDRESSLDVVAGLVEILDQRQAGSVACDMRTKHRCWSLGSMLIRRSVFDRVGSFNEALEAAEDAELIMRISLHGIAIKPIYTITQIYRAHGGNFSRDADRMQWYTLDAVRTVARMRRSRASA